jgi:DNA invertase Pin-like site-specific DNA recombinase
MRVALYQRVSTDDQTVANQLPAMEDWVAARGHEIAGTYQENESAWRNGHQRELAHLLQDIRSGRRRYDVVLVWALDRLSREGPLAVLTLVDTLKRHGCKVVSVQEPWTEAPGEIGEILYSLVAWVAKYESDRRSERVKAGLARAVKEGKTLGRPKGSKDRAPRRKSGYHNRWGRTTA